MTNREYKIISEALEKTKEHIERSFDELIETIKSYGRDNPRTASKTK